MKHYPSIHDRMEEYTLAGKRLSLGFDLTTGEAALLLRVSSCTLLRQMQAQGRMPTQPAKGRRPAYWAGADVLALLRRVEVVHAQAS